MATLEPIHVPNPQAMGGQNRMAPQGHPQQHAGGQGPKPNQSAQMPGGLKGNAGGGNAPPKVPFASEYAGWTIRKASLELLAPEVERQSWQYVTRDKMQITPEELQQEIRRQRKRNEKNGTSTQSLIDEISSSNAREQIDRLITQQNLAIQQQHKEAEWKVVGIDLEWRAIGWREKQLKTIKVILKSQLKQGSRPTKTNTVEDLDQPIVIPKPKLAGDKGPGGPPKGPGGQMPMPPPPPPPPPPPGAAGITGGMGGGMGGGGMGGGGMGGGGMSGNPNQPAIQIMGDDLPINPGYGAPPPKGPQGMNPRLSDPIMEPEPIPVHQPRMRPPNMIPQYPPMHMPDAHTLRKQKSKSRLVDHRHSDSETTDSDSLSSALDDLSIEGEEFRLIDNGKRSSRHRRRHRSGDHRRARSASRSRSRGRINPPPMGRHNLRRSTSRSPRSSGTTLPRSQHQPTININLANLPTGTGGQRLIEPSPSEYQREKVERWYQSSPMSRDSSDRGSDSSFIDTASSAFSRAGDSVFSDPPHSPRTSHNHIDMLKEYPRHNRGSIHDPYNEGRRGPQQVFIPGNAHHGHHRSHHSDYPHKPGHHVRSARHRRHDSMMDGYDGFGNGGYESDVAPVLSYSNRRPIMDGRRHSQYGQDIIPRARPAPHRSATLDDAHYSYPESRALPDPRDRFDYDYEGDERLREQEAARYDHINSVRGNRRMSYVDPAMFDDRLPYPRDEGMRFPLERRGSVRRGGGYPPY